MIKSLGRYIKYFFITIFFRRERILLVENAKNFFFSETKLKQTDNEKGLREAIDWLLQAQNISYDNGFRTFNIVEGWSSSYPETSGYIIPTLLNFSVRYRDKSIISKLIDCSEWLLNIQKKSGGWQSLYVAHDKPEVVFNTAQIVRGLMAIYNYTKDEKYLNATIKACDWLCSVQEDEGYWKEQAFMQVERVYDSYVDFPLLMVYNITGNKLYKESAIKNLYWIINKKQKTNGWFEDCDNTIKHNNKPILHTIAYTIDGLLDSGILLDDNLIIASARKSADALLNIFLKEGKLKGRFDKNWKGSEYMICTGCAQIAIVWMKLYKHFGSEKYIEAARRMNNLLLSIQSRNYVESKSTRGAMPGSFPIWGKYEPFSFPNWATKYFADSLMLELEIKN